MKVTINDVAKLCGVSMKTVSRVINNESSVRQATRDKVMTAVRELNYQPNLAARSLAGTNSYTIAYIYDNPNAYYIIDMQNGILNECRKKNFELLIHPCNAKSAGIIEEITDMIRSSRIAGVVLTPPFSEMPEVTSALNDMDVKFVRIVSGHEKTDDVSPSIMVNDFVAAYDITQHLIDLGHSDIGFISGGKEHKSTTERIDGYKAALNDNNIKVQANLIIDGEYDFESGVQGANKLLKQKQAPSAIFACNDEIAAGALFASRLQNVQIPDKLSIVGFENSPFSRQTWPKITTADQPNQTIAERATNLLINTIQGQEIDELCEQFTPSLLVRDSSGKIS
ncbi:LacI family DNA-binding transcriptional regulator [Thalassotalea sp. HSM 43]|uniref:LacI family DNA-binding transcriptional regulator n=1 Tax=Thalassotalea sp. HSM 43 TaxID=2552945 RepID=UPI001081B3D0|nr:LacI family DNA-binding transcriptional regulator [Thalassotalea sp. HSM 43]QBY05404.1 LacI family DNA-binding transcriptional regulator [Thalassotalea sp. HSM 43]